MVGRGALVAAVAAAVLLTVASASGASQQLKLAVLPLPKTALGQAGHSLSLAADSGADSNAHSASQASGNVTAAQLQHLGRVSGYSLDYGNPFSGSPAVSEIATEAEQYRSAALARKGLGFWRKQELDNRQLKSIGLNVTFKKVALAHVAQPHWAYLTIGKVHGLKPVYAVDAEMLDGDYLLDVSIGAGSAAAAKRLVPGIAQKLDQRLRLAQSGDLHAKPVTLPRAKPGPLPHGPKPGSMVLTKSDVGTPATIQRSGYVNPRNAFDEYATSAYDLLMAPAGSYGYFSQEVMLANSALEVKYFAALGAAALAHGGGEVGAATPVNVGSAGDHAHGELVRATIGGNPAYEAVVVLWRGKYLDFVLGASPTKLTASDVQSLAQKAAHRLNVGVGLEAQAPTTWTSQRRSRSRSSSMKRTRCHVPSCSSPSRTGTDSPAVPSSIAMQCEWPLP